MVIPDAEMISRPAKNARQPSAESNRRLIYLARSANQGLVADLQAGGWEVTVSPGAKVAMTRGMAIGPVAGLVILDDFRPKDCAALEQCLSQRSIGWVAAASAPRLSDATVRRLVRDYCFDYVTLPSVPERITRALGHALGMSGLNVVDALEEAPVEKEDALIGSCDVMHQLFRAIRKIAASDASVFIAGESGTGKELTAVAIHKRSARRNAPFVAINCGAIPRHLLQSELFGYERGAFTGAIHRKAGRVEAADGGTLFLDEIGDMPVEAQAGLLRFLQERKFERLGGHSPIAVDARIICATHIDLDMAIRDGRFRADLFHRLCVLRIDEPPLRARGQDIKHLAHHFLNQFRRDGARNIKGFMPSAISAMHSYSWPGNVRELLNRVRRAIVMTENSLISAQDLDLADVTPPQIMTLAQAREAAQKQAIEEALLRRNRLGEAASDLRISRATLYRMMTAYGLSSSASVRAGGRDEEHENSDEK
ncbi:sigma-54 dependent transcriptional regulator [Paraburkholderia lycopersici]|uniref:DNA-binding transcriptional response regulator, NtrC family, contains REC, AAA-type ATPase, and a Fis-type DNA-binding domains n=1 Tax=Paraburkholderia lycopersici TaxID=416944 RepID=A0A1G6PCZ1_9BURK|nr:sigma-54 dependent transcriptional regulator [Paraburkholderia lycopersici]SDC77444.1 DNA-binding transcriptional response regulator, NtrC family, contains REC, AAA-type ATPase, and a Fis-type DNA-binding domains [Paraburkholderia lycopersici]